MLGGKCVLKIKMKWHDSQKLNKKYSVLIVVLATIWKKNCARFENFQKTSVDDRMLD